MNIMQSFTNRILDFILLIEFLLKRFEILNKR